MGYSDALRAGVEALLLGESGVSPWVFPAGHLKRREGADTLATYALNALERRMDVDVGLGAPLAPVNHLQGYGLFSHPLIINVGYILTGAGDAFDALGEQSGTATLEAVQDRANTDAHAIHAVLGYLGNWPSLNTTGLDVIDVRAGTGSLGTLVQSSDRAILSVALEVWVRAALPGLTLRPPAL